MQQRQRRRPYIGTGCKAVTRSRYQLFLSDPRLGASVRASIDRRLTIKHLVVSRFRAVEDGRCTAALKRNGREVEVAAGYDVTGDKFRMRVDIREWEGGSRRKIDCLAGHEDNKALRKGVAFAIACIDATVWWNCA